MFVAAESRGRDKRQRGGEEGVDDVGVEFMGGGHVKHYFFGFAGREAGPAGAVFTAGGVEEVLPRALGESDVMLVGSPKDADLPAVYRARIVYHSDAAVRCQVFQQDKTSRVW